jgi:hypothetical protein
MSKALMHWKIVEMLVEVEPMKPARNQSLTCVITFHLEILRGNLAQKLKQPGVIDLKK